MASERREIFDRRDALKATLFFAVALLLRVPFRSQFAYNWDSAEFAIGVRDYNVGMSQPHVPGYFLYVMLGRLVDFVVHDAHASLVWLSVVAGAVLVALMYLLGAAMFRRAAGVIAACLALTSPQVWFHSCVALTYMVDAALACGIVLFCWRAMQSGCSFSRAAGIGLFLGLSAGVRPQSLAILSPPIVCALWFVKEQRVAKLMTVFAVAFAVCAAWLAAMTRLSGGWHVVLEAESRNAAFNAVKTLAVGGWEALLWNVTFAASSCWNGIGAAGVVLVVALFASACGRRVWDIENRDAMRLIAVWGLGMVVLATFVGFTDQPGHMLGLLPPLLLLAASVISGFRKRIVLATLVCALNAAVFVALPPQWDRWFLGMGRTGRDIRGHDAVIARTIDTVRKRYSPASVVIYHALENIHFGLRHFQLYLPEFEQYQMAYDRVMSPPSERPHLAVIGGKLVFAALPHGRAVLLLVPPEKSVALFSTYLDVSGAEPIGSVPATVWLVPHEPKIRVEKSGGIE